MPGRQMDQAAARWRGQPLGAMACWRRASSPPPQRARRDLTRDRTTLVQARSRARTRLPGVLERAQITLAAVATDRRGVSARALWAALRQGRADPAPLAERAHGRRRTTRPGLEPARTGRLRDHDRRRLTRYWAPIDGLAAPSDGRRVARTRDLGAWAAAMPAASDPTERLAEVASPGAGEMPDPPRRCVQAIAGLDTMPGVDQRGAELGVAAGGTARGRFGTASRLSAWTGVAPGHDERAGTQRSGTTRTGHRPLRPGLPPIAPAAARTQGTSLSALSQRGATRRGQNRALMAVAHALVVRAVHLRSCHAPDRALGANDGDAQRRTPLVEHLTRRLQR